MKQNEIEKCICNFVKEFANDSFLRNNMGLVSEISSKLCGKVHSKKDVRDYFDFMLVFIDNMNLFLSKKKVGYIHYSRILNFAKNEERINEFLFKTNLERKAEKDSLPGMAGFLDKDKDQDEKSEKSSSNSILFKKKKYDHLVSFSGLSFFFNLIERKFLVKSNKSSRIIGYAEYVKSYKEKEKKYAKKSDMLREIKSQDLSTDASASFEIYMDQLKNEREKNKNKNKKKKKKITKKRK